MRITFVLPGYSMHPIGGFKAVYQFANGLAARGHRPVILHPKGLDGGSTPPPLRLARRAKDWWRAQARVPWFELHSGVVVRHAPNLWEGWAPDGDAVVATAWQTAAVVADYGGRKGRKYCLVADYEHWATATDDWRRKMALAFRDPLTLVSYGPAVTDMLAALGRRPAAEIHVGPDHEAFGTDVAPESRAGHACGFPVRPEWFKGSADAAAAAVRVKARMGEVTFRAFGRIPSPGLPPWIDYLVRPTDAELRRFYNSLALFVLPSHYEAWPLPGLEAMACGAALVCADSPGVRGYARHGHTALLVPAGRPDLLAEVIEGLLHDEARRVTLAHAGRQAALGYRWDEAVASLEAVLAG